MKIIAQMDDIKSINIEKDSTFAIMLAAQERGHEIFYFLPQTLSMQNNIIKANIYKIKLQKKINDHVQILENKIDELVNYDAILVRQDPPFDMNYITNSYILERIKDKILILNDPVQIRNCPEKIFVNDFADFTPPTIITSDLDQIKEFQEKYQEIIIKPLYSCGGDGVFYLKENDQNINVLVETMINHYKAPLIAQKFIKDVKNGDKRVLLLNGEILGAVNRKPQGNDIRSNFHAGGMAQKAKLNKKELEICKIVGQELRNRGLIFVGIDLIGNYVTEINVTSPTGINEINYLNNSKIEDQIIKFIENNSVN
ncbi:glutathione synthase [Rickettsiales bacterium]|nr:glutathione synthase [Rickettsiales bacterium]